MSVPDVAPLLEGEPVHDQVVFGTRLQRYWPDLLSGLSGAYPDRAPEMARRLVMIAAENFRQRSADLRLLDLRRHADPQWFSSQRMLGYATYADRFGGTLRGVAQKVDYLAELGVTYLHLLPLLRPRPGANDGGYAVMDYRAVREDLGTIDDLRDLATTLRSRGISLTLDLVLNHVAAEHSWAEAARSGDPYFRGFFHLFADRSVPDAYEQTLPEVFPDIAPGNFTWVEELGRWVWTTFNDYQWDLDYTNPEVFRAMAEVMLDLAAVGVDVLRLDAVPFLWKRTGTNSQNQPEVHDVLQACRALVRIVAPGVAFKAEAIVSPRDLVGYLGAGRHEGKECDLAYHNVLMVLLWSALASGRVGLLTHTLRAMPPVPPGSGWVTYVRCHDDIGWAITEEDAAAVGEDGYAHRRFLADFYAGDFPGSFARGDRFQANPLTGDARTSGTAASLAGLEAALESGDEA